MEEEHLSLNIVYDRTPYFDCEEIIGSVNLEPAKRALTLPEWVNDDTGSGSHQRYEKLVFSKTLNSSWFSYSYLRKVVETAWIESETVPSFYFVVDRSVLGIDVRVPVLHKQEERRRLDRDAEEVFIKADGQGSISDALKARQEEQLSNYSLMSSSKSKLGGSRSSSSGGRLSSSIIISSRPAQMKSKTPSLTDTEIHQAWVVFLVTTEMESSKSLDKQHIIAGSPATQSMRLWRNNVKSKFSKGLVPLGEIVTPITASFARARKVIKKYLTLKDGDATTMAGAPENFDFLAFPEEISVQELTKLGDDASFPVKRVKREKEADEKITRLSGKYGSEKSSAPIFIVVGANPPPSTNKKKTSSLCVLS